MRTILHNCGEIAHLSTGDDEDPLSGERLLDRESLVHPAGMAIMISGGIVQKIAPSDDILSEFAPWYPANSVSTDVEVIDIGDCLLYTSPSPRDATLSRMPSSA